MEKYVIHIDDDPIFLMVTEQVNDSLEVSSYFQTFTNAQKALEFIAENLHDYRFQIFLDLNMPKMNGWEFLDALLAKEIREDLSVIILSSSVNGEDRKKADTYHVVKDFISKPIDAIQLQKLLT